MEAVRVFDHSGLEVLDADECLRLLRTVPLGRVVFTLGALPAIRLVNFVVDDDTLVFATTDGDKYRAAERGDIVAFEVDDFDTDRHVGWTVTAIGHLSVVSEGERLDLDRRLPLRSWAYRNSDDLVRVGIESITGRRLLAWAQRPHAD
jgi:Pyridoxamine 5'-phosphate oxidase